MCGLGQSVGFLPLRPFVFGLPWARDTLFSPCLPACLALHPGQPREHQENCRLVGVPPCG